MGDDFGARLRELRRARGLSQSDLATDAGLGQRNISDYERGVRDPRLSTVVRLASALEVPVRRLVEDSDGA